jgi:hypothetical protein
MHLRAHGRRTLKSLVAWLSDFRLYTYGHTYIHMLNIHQHKRQDARHLQRSRRVAAKHLDVQAYALDIVLLVQVRGHQGHVHSPQHLACRWRIRTVICMAPFQQTEELACSGRGCRHVFWCVGWLRLRHLSLQLWSLLLRFLSLQLWSMLLRSCSLGSSICCRLCCRALGPLVRQADDAWAHLTIFREELFDRYQRHASDLRKRYVCACMYVCA